MELGNTHLLRADIGQAGAGAIEKSLHYHQIIGTKDENGGDKRKHFGQ
jgi:hypothetical protein